MGSIVKKLSLSFRASVAFVGKVFVAALKHEPSP